MHSQSRLMIAPPIPSRGRWRRPPHPCPRRHRLRPIACLDFPSLDRSHWSGVEAAETDRLRLASPSEPRDERALVADARGDPAAFGVLYRRYVERIFAFTYRRTWTPEAAEDVTAATFERAWRHLDRFDADGPGFGPWLFRIAAN